MYRGTDGYYVVKLAPVDTCFREVRNVVSKGEPSAGRGPACAEVGLAVTI